MTAPDSRAIERSWSSFTKPIPVSCSYPRLEQVGTVDATAAIRSRPYGAALGAPWDHPYARFCITSTSSPAPQPRPYRVLFACQAVLRVLADVSGVVRRDLVLVVVAFGRVREWLGRRATTPTVTPPPSLTATTPARHPSPSPSGKKRAVLARHVRNRRPYDAVDQWAFCSLSRSYRPGVSNRFRYYDGTHPGSSAGPSACAGATRGELPGALDSGVLRSWAPGRYKGRGSPKDLARSRVLRLPGVGGRVGGSATIASISAAIRDSHSVAPKRWQASRAAASRWMACPGSVTPTRRPLYRSTGPHSPTNPPRTTT
jgi:hypothetical protein